MPTRTDAGARLSMIVSAFEFADVRSTDDAILDLSGIAKTTVSGIAFLDAGFDLARRHRAIAHS